RMLTHDAQPAPAADAAAAGTAATPEGALPEAAETKVRIARVTPAGAATVAGAAAGALRLGWVLFGRGLPFSGGAGLWVSWVCGVLGFWVSWYCVFLILYACMARLQWDAREVSHRLALVAFTTGGILAVAIVAGQVLFIVARGLRAVLHLNFWTQSLAFAGPL